MNRQGFETVDEARTFLEEGGEIEAEIFHTLDENLTPLSGAAHKGRVDVGEFLISRGANINNKSGRFDWAPLHLACIDGHPQIVQLLLNNIAIDINSKNYLEQTPLHRACILRRPTCVELLLNSNHLIEDINAEDHFTATALAVAVDSENEEIAKLLLSYKGIRINLYEHYKRIRINRHEDYIKGIIKSEEDKATEFTKKSITMMKGFSDSNLPEETIIYILAFVYGKETIRKETVVEFFAHAFGKEIIPFDNREKSRVERAHYF